MTQASSSSGGDPEFVAFIRNGRRRGGPVLLHSRAVRFAVLVLLLVIGGLFYLSHRLGQDRDLELIAFAEPGEASLEIKAEPTALSPLCGCLRKSPLLFQRRSGIAIPSRLFSLGVTALSSGDVRDETWQLTAMAPEIEPINWVAPPVQTVAMQVLVERDGRLLRLFHGRVTFLEVVGKGPMEVVQDPKFPYAAVLPAYRGSTDITSQPSSREGGGGSLDIDTWTPSRDWVEPGYGRSLDALQRGPMVDLLGMTTFYLGRLGRSRIYAGLMPVPGLRRDDAVTIKVRAAFAVRLYPTPAPRSWTNGFGSVPPAGYPPDASAQLRAGTDRGTLVGRFLVTEPLPQYTVRLQQVAVPVRRQWVGLAARSGAQMKPMLDPRLQIEPYAVLRYRLPPVPRRPEVSVFGSLNHYDSDALTGELKIDSESLHIHRGENVAITSEDGIHAGHHPYTSLISAGTATGLAELLGSGQISVDGDSKTKLTWLSWVAGAIGTTLIALLVGGFIGWVRRGRSP